MRRGTIGARLHNGVDRTGLGVYAPTAGPLRRMSRPSPIRRFGLRPADSGRRSAMSLRLNSVMLRIAAAIIAMAAVAGGTVWLTQKSTAAQTRAYRAPRTPDGR